MDTKETQIEEWSDKQCLTIGAIDHFPATVKNLNVQKNVISRYLNFYLGGKIQKGLSARDLTLAVIAIMPISSTNEEFIWPEKEYSETGNLFFLTPEDRLKYEIDCLFKKKNIDEDKQNENVNNKEVAEEIDIESSTNKEEDITDNNSDTSQAADASDSDSSDNEKGTIPENKEETNKSHSEVHQATDSTTSVTSQPELTLDMNDLKWYRIKRDELSRSNNQVPKYGPVDNAKFCTTCNHLLDAWESSENSRISLKYFFAMTALFVMRAKAKSFQNITKYFSNNIGDSDFMTSLNHYTIPHRGFLKKCWKSFHNNDLPNRIMFAKLVVISLRYPDRLSGWGKRNIIKYAVLSHTTYFGMGIIGMLQQLASFYHPYFDSLFKLLYSDKTASSWNRVYDFLKKYLNKEANQLTFHWAGVIDNNSMNHLSCSNNFELAVVIAVLIEKNTKNSNIWQSSWVTKGSCLEECKKLGDKIFNNYTELLLQKLKYSIVLFK